MRHLSAYFLPLNEPIAGMYFDWNFYSVLHKMKVRKIRKTTMGVHTTYSWNIKWQKCAGMSLNGFIFKKINEK